MPHPTLTQLAARLGVTPDQVARHLQRNAAQIHAMAAQATRTGRKVNHYTAAELTHLAQQAQTHAATLRS